MEQDEQLHVHDVVWNFSVTDPRLHSKGFTVYKVSCKCFSIKCPELITELVCWKRYNDFKLLYKSLMILHKAQQGNDPFPEFVKPTIFGRFTENVIEKRRQSAVELLNFISTRPHLYKSPTFKHFLEEGRVQSDFNKRGSLLVSRSSKSNVISSGLKGDADAKAHITPPNLKLDNMEKVKLGPGAQLAEKPGSESNEQTAHLVEGREALGQGQIEQTVLEGTWNFPQVADDVSLGSSTEDEIVDADDDLVSASSLPDASFDNRSQSSAKAVMGKSISGSTKWLQEGLNICACMGSETITSCQCLFIEFNIVCIFKDVYKTDKMNISAPRGEIANPVLIKIKGKQECLLYTYSEKLINLVPSKPAVLKLVSPRQPCLAHIP